MQVSFHLSSQLIDINDIKFRIVQIQTEGTSTELSLSNDAEKTKKFINYHLDFH